MVKMCLVQMINHVYHLLFCLFIIKGIHTDHCALLIAAFFCGGGGGGCRWLKHKTICVNVSDHQYQW
jgi:hypothetical protein